MICWILFSMRRGKLIGMLQMFMTKESIADRIQQELIRLTSHPKARTIVTSLITNEYQTFKDKPLNQLLDASQFNEIAENLSVYVTTYASNQANKPVVTLMPQFVDYLEVNSLSKLANLIIEKLSIHLSTIMKKWIYED